MISHAHLSFRTQPKLGEKSLFASIFPLLTFERANLLAFNLPTFLSPHNVPFLCLNSGIPLIVSLKFSL